jgi:hypothetical protein
MVATGVADRARDHRRGQLRRRASIGLRRRHPLR